MNRDKGTKEFTDSYKLYYTGKDSTINGVGITVDNDLKGKLVGVKRLGDRPIANKLMLEEGIIHIINAYAQSGRARKFL